MIERYSREAMSRVWSDENRLRTMLRVEEAFLEVLARVKGIPASELKAFKTAAHQGLQERVKAGEAKSGHEIIALLSAVSALIKDRAPALNRYLHYGLTSSDVLDTALALQLRESADLLMSDWDEVCGRLRTLARKHKSTWMAGRTHGVHAEPVTFGVKLAGWHAEALRNMERLSRAREEISFGKLSGAVGCFTQVGPEYEAGVLNKLGLKPEPVATQVVPRDRHAQYFHALVLSAAAVERFALEIRHLQRTEVLEAEEPFGEGQKGSSAMPHKRNPILCENLCGLSRLIRSYESAVVENIVLWHERDISHSSVERVVFPDAHIALDFMLGRFKKVLDGLQVYPERMKENLDRSLGLVFSQKVLLRLVDAGLTREQAYELVQRNAMKTWRTREAFVKVLESDPAVMKQLSKKDLAACFDLETYSEAISELLSRGGVA
ncbi:MAG TPA: adenylosuccinate lyase [Elusimicrobia bacterium]|nr:adenylosuccinate lyase [Elusimicrobiota bacterium]HBT61460.1 adenylosuccinate lyase [Elusimicrobiota bacterium]